jgi:hypothetical protein
MDDGNMTVVLLCMFGIATMAAFWFAWSGRGSGGDGNPKSLRRRRLAGRPGTNLCFEEEFPMIDLGNNARMNNRRGGGGDFDALSERDGLALFDPDSVGVGGDNEGEVERGGQPIPNGGPAAWSSASPASPSKKSGDSVFANFANFAKFDSCDVVTVPPRAVTPEDDDFTTIPLTGSSSTNLLS